MIKDCFENATAYNFFQLNNLLKRLINVGNQLSTFEEIVRYRANDSLGFPKSDIESIEFAQVGQDIEHIAIEVNFMGLYGPSSPLPTFYTERILQAEDENTAIRDFCDVFNHRLISLLQRCWEKYRYYVAFKPDATDEFSTWMFSIGGLGIRKHVDATGLKWDKLLPFINTLAKRTCSAIMLANLVKFYFDLKDVQIQQCVRREIAISDFQLTKLGQTNADLGLNLMLGTTIDDYASKFRIQLNDLSLTQFKKFVPTGEYYKELISLVNLAIKDALVYDIALNLDNTDSKPLSLDGSYNPLGWTTRIGQLAEAEVTEAIILKGNA